MKRKAKVNLQKRFQRAYMAYGGQLKADGVTDQNVLVARMFIEGSIEVALGLLEESENQGYTDLAQAIRQSLEAAHSRLAEARGKAYG